MKVCFRAKNKKVCFMARTRKSKVPKQLRPFLFKAGSAKLKRIQAKARKGYKAWRRSR